MNPDSEILSQYLDQTQQLYGNHLFLEKKLKDELAVPYNNLDEFHRLICECQKCPLGKTRNNFVFGVGNPQADIVFIGEAPGEKEDLLGIPFVGRAGKLLDKILSAIKLSRDDIYIYAMF